MGMSGSLGRRCFWPCWRNTETLSLLHRWMITRAGRPDHAGFAGAGHAQHLGASPCSLPGLGEQTRVLQRATSTRENHQNPAAGGGGGKAGRCPRGHRAQSRRRSAVAASHSSDCPRRPQGPVQGFIGSTSECHSVLPRPDRGTLEREGGTSSYIAKPSIRFSSDRIVRASSELLTPRAVYIPSPPRDSASRLSLSFSIKRVGLT